MNVAQKKVALACSVCGSRNYTVPASPNRKVRLEVKKYCKYCGKHTLHRETR
nr:50S ribosomal protein L33 [Secundilactobacillus angelensis]